MIEYFKLVVELIRILSWPFVVLLLFFLFRDRLTEMISRIMKVTFTSKGIELVLDELGRTHQLSLTQKKKLSSLAGDEIWNLSDIAKTKDGELIHNMNPAKKVVVKSLNDKGLIMILQKGSQRRVEITPLGQELLTIANKII